MKRLLLCATVLALASCSRNESGAPASKAAQGPNPRFYEVQKKLDPGGSFYLYADVKDIFRNVAGRIDGLVQQAAAEGGPVDQENARVIRAAIDEICTQFSLYQIQDFGMSVTSDGDLNRRKIFVRIPGEAVGLRKSLGGAPVERRLLHFAPETTAIFFDTDFLPGVFYSSLLEGWQRVAPAKQKNAIELGIIRLEGLSNLPLRKILQSLGGEMSFAFTLDDASPITLPLPTGDPVKIGRPGLLVALQASDSTFYDSLRKLFTSLRAPIEDVPLQGGATAMALPPLPLPIPVRFAFAHQEGFFLIASDPALLADGLRRLKDQKGGLAAAPEFVKTFKDLPVKNNGVMFVSPRIAQSVDRFAAQLPPAQAGPIRAQLAGVIGEFASVRVNDPDGLYWIARTKSSGGELVMAGAVAPVGIMVAVAVPGFIRAREVSRRNACQENLTRIDGAKAAWALENHKSGTDVPTWDDLVKSDGMGYLKTIPQCPCGGVYTIGAVDVVPQCSYGTGEFAHRFPIPESNQ